MLTLKKRKEFKRIATEGVKVVLPNVVVQACNHPARPPLAPMRIGLTCSKKVGKAVVRNRAKRRLRAAVAKVCSNPLLYSGDYVFIGRAQRTAVCAFSDLTENIRTAMQRINHTPKHSNSHNRQIKYHPQSKNFQRIKTL